MQDKWIVSGGMVDCNQKHIRRIAAPGPRTAIHSDPPYG